MTSRRQIRGAAEPEASPESGAFLPAQFVAARDAVRTGRCAVCRSATAARGACAAADCQQRWDSLPHGQVRELLAAGGALPLTRHRRTPWCPGWRTQTAAAALA